MKLEIGKTYKDRDGDPCRVIGEITEWNCEQRVFVVEREGDHRSILYYSEDGKHFLDKDNVMYPCRPRCQLFEMTHELPQKSYRVYRIQVIRFEGQLVNAANRDIAFDRAQHLDWVETEREFQHNIERVGYADCPEGDCDADYNIM